MSQEKINRRDLLKTAAATGALISLSGCADILDGDTDKQSEQDREEMKRQYNVTNRQKREYFDAFDKTWRINVEDSTGTLDNRVKDFEPENEWQTIELPRTLPTNDLNTNDPFLPSTMEEMNQLIEEEGYEKGEWDVGVIDVYDRSEEDWINILRHDIEEEVETYVQGRGGTVEEVFQYVDDVFNEPENFYEKHNIRGRLVFDNLEDQHWTDKLIIGLQIGTLRETNIGSSGARSGAIYALFRKYSEEKLDKTILDDFHNWEIRTEAGEKDEWELNHNIHGLAYREGDDWNFKVIEPSPPNRGPYTDSVSENIRKPEETDYLDDSNDWVSTLTPTRTLELANQGKMSTNEKNTIHGRIIGDIWRMCNSSESHRMRINTDSNTDYDVWTSQSFRDSIEDNFVGEEFDYDNLMDAVYAGRNLMVVGNELGYDKPIAIDGTLDEMEIWHAPEEKIEEAVENDYQSIDQVIN